MTDDKKEHKAKLKLNKTA